MTVPDTALSTLERADGSATYSANDYTVVGSVNGPIEVQRRDELPQEATIEVNIRPAVGVGSTRERHLETLVHSTVRRILLTHAFPRSLIQLTLQIISSPEQPENKLATSNLLVLPALLQTAMLTLLSSSLPLECTFTSTALAVRTGQQGRITEMAEKNLGAGSSLHVFAFTSRGQLLLSESEGTFTIEEWEAAHDRAKIICCADSSRNDSMEVEGDQHEVNMKQWLKSTVQKQVDKDEAWKS